MPSPAVCLFPRSRPPLLALVLPLLVVVVLLPSLSAAQTPSDKTTARNLFFEAKAAHEAGDFARAAELFGRSDALFPAPTAALGRARALRDGGKLVAAFEAYASLIQAPLASDVPDAFARARQAAVEERSALEPRLPSVVLEVTCDGCRPTVLLDGKEVPPAALAVKLFVDPGDHSVRVEAPDWQPTDVVVTAQEGTSTRVPLALVRAQAIVPTPEPVPPPPPARPRPPPPPATPPPSTGSSALFITGVVVGGVGLMSLVVAGATGGLYLEDKATVDEGCPQLGGQRVCATSEAFDAAERGRTLGLINTITLPVGIVALGVGAALFFVAADGTTEVSFAPTLGPQHGGAVLRGRF